MTRCPSLTGGWPTKVGVHAVLGTLASPGTCISLRVPAGRSFSLEDCVASGPVTPGAAKLAGTHDRGQTGVLDQWWNWLRQNSPLVKT
jgi:Flp pilus assembly CpaF family ATPase